MSSASASVSVSVSELVLGSVVVRGRPKRAKKSIEISGDDLFAELVERGGSSSSLSEVEVKVVAEEKRH